MGKGVLWCIGWQCVVVDCYWMVGQDEFYVGIFGGYDFVNVFDLYGGVEYVDVLYFYYQFVLVECWILCFELCQFFWCLQFLDVDIFEECFEMFVLGGDVVFCKGFDCL